MAVTLTIKQVPDRLAQKLRDRAAAHHRSLQGELMAILHAAADANRIEQTTPAYEVRSGSRKSEAPTHGARLTLRELWERSRRLGAKSPEESASIVRALRDERYRR